MRNAQDAISMIQTAEGALNEVHSILQRMKLAIQAGNDTNTDEIVPRFRRKLTSLLLKSTVSQYYRVQHPEAS